MIHSYIYVDEYYVSCVTKRSFSILGERKLEIKSLYRPTRGRRGGRLFLFDVLTAKCLFWIIEDMFDALACVFDVFIWKLIRFPRAAEISGAADAYDVCRI